MGKKKKIKEIEFDAKAEEATAPKVEKELDKKEADVVGNIEDSLSDTKFLSSEQQLEVKVSNLQREIIKKDIQVDETRDNFFERERILCKLRIKDNKNRLMAHETRHEETLAKIGKKLGVDLKKSAINWETGEVKAGGSY